MAAGERGRVLVVDQCEPVRKVICLFLERAGFSCVEAQFADQAERIFGDGTAFTAVVTDYELVGPSGAELIARLSRRAPSVPLLLMSAAQPRPQLRNVPGARAVLGKLGEGTGLSRRIIREIERARSAPPADSPGAP